MSKVTLPVEPLFCKNCGEELKSPEQVHCGRCGTAVNQGMPTWKKVGWAFAICVVLAAIGTPPQSRPKPAVPATPALSSEDLKKIVKKQNDEDKKRGIQIGMSKQDVLASNWGKPKRVNRTSTARGEMEQWDYGNGSYVYFDGDFVTVIQN